MRNYLISFLDDFSYPEEARAEILHTYDVLASDAQIYQTFRTFLCQYEQEMKFDFYHMLDDMAALSRTAGIHAYTGYMVLLICLSKTLKDYYRLKGLDERVWIDSMYDLKWKLDECRCVYGIWGTFVPWWYRGFFALNIFGFGSLQFEPVRFGRHYEKEGIVLSPESIVLNTHIPRTGKKLDTPSRLSAYAAGAAFFREHFGIERPVFVCHSWLLYPRNKEILSPQSNLYAFLNDFDIIEQGEYEDYRETWRLFDCLYQGDVDQLPQDSSLRRAYADWIRKGEKTGWGYGVKC